jgi:hypothetical protein
LQATLVILGTSLSLQEVDQVYSAVARETNFTRITHFPSFDEKDVESVLSELVDMSDCTLQPDKHWMLTGRAQFSVSVVRHLFNCYSDQHSKQINLDNAINTAIGQIMADLKSKVRGLIGIDKTGKAARLLGRMVLAYKLQGGKIWFESIEQSDFVNNALCGLRPHFNDVHLIMDEPMVVEAVQETLEDMDVDPEFLKYLDQFNRIITNFGINSAAKGAALELLVRRSLQRFNGFRLVDLPFLKGSELPAWCDELELQIDAINTAEGFGYADKGIQADIEFLINRPSNKLLVEQSGTRQDGAWFFSDNDYAGSLAIKLYSEPLSSQMHAKNETSSDIRCSFLKNDGKTSYQALKEIRKTFEESDTAKLKGILRIHLEFPSAKGFEPGVYIKRDTDKDIEDVMVYINLSNMDEFFYEDIKENKQDMRNLKRMIKFVATK